LRRALQAGPEGLHRRLELAAAVSDHGVQVDGCGRLLNDLCRKATCGTETHPCRFFFWRSGVRCSE
jgi:hypothetical protein